MSKHLKVAMIGTGGISRTHMPGWQASEYAEVVAASDVISASLEAWGKSWNVDRLTTDVQEIIEDPKIDIIDRNTLVPITTKGSLDNPKTELDLGLFMKETGDRLLKEPGKILEGIGDLLGGGKDKKKDK